VLDEGEGYDTDQDEEYGLAAAAIDPKAERETCRRRMFDAGTRPPLPSSTATGSEAYRF
jgi:hypothetical protein